VSWRPPDNWSYAYLLGVYLGDGYLSPSGQLLVVCDLRYPQLIEECCGAMILTSLRRHVGLHPQGTDRCVRVTCSWQGWFDALPQHGPGRKHERPIVLEPWQQDIVAEHPWRFLRGLLHSDGCRTINRFKTTLPSGRVAEYAYPRWFFSNVSADIRGLFCATCEQVGVRWTLSNHRNVSVSHRRSVALLDEHVGAKG
jgi:hypothetical protein